MNKITKKQIAIIGEKARRFNLDKWWDLLADFGIEKIEDLENDKFDAVIKYIKDYNDYAEYCEDIAYEEYREGMHRE